MSLSFALLVYRIMAYIVGVMLIVVFVSIPFDSVERVVGPIHGALYIVYLAVSLNLVRRARLSWWTMLAMVTEGGFRLPPSSSSTGLPPGCGPSSINSR